MATSTDKIKTGLDKGQAISKTPSKNIPPRLADLANLRGDLPAIEHQRSAVIAAHAALAQIRDATANAIQEQAAAIKAKYDAEGWINGDKPGLKTDILGADKRRMLRDKATREMEKEVRAINAESITKQMTAIRDARAKLDLMSELWSDPVRVLMRSTLASERRLTYCGNLSAAGPIEVSEAAHAAVMEGDKDLAAACCVRIDSMGKEPRKLLTVSKNDLAEEIMADAFQQARVNIGVASIHADMAELAVREATGSKVRPEEKIGLDMRIRDLEKSLGISVADAFKNEEKTVVEAGSKIRFEDKSEPNGKDENEPDPVEQFYSAMDRGDWVTSGKIARELGWIDEETSEDE